MLHSIYCSSSSLLHTIRQRRLLWGPIEFPPLRIFSFFFLYLFYFSIYYIYQESAERAASSSIFGLKKQIELKGTKRITKKSNKFFFQKKNTYRDYNEKKIIKIISLNISR